MKRLTLVLALTPMVAQAQTFDEAVVTNLSAGIEMCARHMSDVNATIRALNAAGFAYSTYGDSATTYHEFQAPADTAKVTLVVGQLAPECIVSTSNLDHTSAIAVVNEVTAKFFEGRFQVVPIGAPYENCANFVEQGAQLPLNIFVAEGSSDPTCVSNGTTLIRISNSV